MQLVTILNDKTNVLRKRALRVGTFDRNLHLMLDSMTRTMHAKEGVGLAAPQVGVSQRVVVIEYKMSPTYHNAVHRYEMINPVIVKTRGNTIDREECLSIPGYAADVERSVFAKVKFQDRNGKSRSINTRGVLARIVQHEIDHLDGVLMTDKAERLFMVEESEIGYAKYTEVEQMLLGVAA